MLGDVAADALGAVNTHEHLFQVSPLLPGDELDDEAASGEEAASLRASGFDAMVDATPMGLARDAEGLARISAATGLGIVATTGRHREAHYAPGHPLHSWSREQLARRFAADVADGMLRSDVSHDGPTARAPGGDVVRAGMLKGGIDYWRISPFERTTLDALAEAHRATGAPVMVHLEFCTAAHEVLDLLGAEGVRADRVLLAHADRDPDPGLHADLAARGAFLGYDGFARPRSVSDAALLDLAERVLDAGAGDRVVLGGDVARRTRYLAYGGMPGLQYLGLRYLPRLRARVGDAAVERMLVANPARLLDLSR
ncbi:phosphotriesterase family protein [Agromyces sp. SYSU T00194]|uniref:phosphotriesterase family protein n=1 Tax=Agromyces chitinivorans TaxID=3158560 RepID=UPI0033938D64